MSEGMTVPPNWTRRETDWGEDVGRKYDPHAVVEYAHVDLDVRVVLAPGRVPADVAESNRGYRVTLHNDEGDPTTHQIAVVPDLERAHDVAADLMRLFTEFHTDRGRIDRMVRDLRDVKLADWRARDDARRPRRTAGAHA